MTDSPRQYHSNGADHLSQWLLSLGLLAFTLLATEVFWQKQGFGPSVTDNLMLWSDSRDRASGDKVMVFLGASRMQSGLNLQTIRSSFSEHEIIQLAYPALSPYSTLKHLMEDESFSGIIVCSMRANWLLPRYMGDQRRLVEHYEGEYGASRNLDERINARVHARLQAWFTPMSSELRLLRLLQTELEPTPSASRSLRDRSKQVFYSQMNRGQVNRIKRRVFQREVKKQWMATSRASERFRSGARNGLRKLYEKLKRRGGELVFVRLPTGGRYWAADERNFPRARFWDNISRWTGAPSIHFMDYRSLSKFSLPDESHLDGNDVPAFTRSLVGILNDKIRPGSLKAKEGGAR